jgi:lysophospholipase L1-like esterase
MANKYLRRSMLFVLAMVFAVLAGQPAAFAQAVAPIRVMPLGDSITGSPGCWRALLWNQLQNAGYQDIDFVGTLGPQGCSVPYDGDNEGHGGALVTNVAAQNQLPGWLSATRPDVVLMHFGTNDAWSNISPTRILDAYSTLVGQMRASNPNMKILVAQIIPMNPSSCPECAGRVVALNAAIPDWAAAISTAASPVVVVDQWSGFDTAVDTYDGVHPNSAGDQKMANRWFPALTPFL